MIRVLTMFSMQLRPKTLHKVDHAKQTGFTLVEIAVVLVVVGFLLGSILGPLSSQRETANIRATEVLLEDVRDALYGFAALNGYLPCPWENAGGQPANTFGFESRVAGAGSDCAVANGFVPYATLGINGQLDSDSQLSDKWAGSIRYRISAVDNWAYAKAITPTTAAPDLNICTDSACGSFVAANVVATIYSLGPDLGIGVNSADEQENTDGDVDFVSRTWTEDGANQFDDLVIWISPNPLTLYLVRAGRFGGG